METFGERLKKARKEKGITQKELAELVGVKQGTIARWERNVQEPSFSTLGFLATIFQVRTGYWLDGY